MCERSGDYGTFHKAEEVHPTAKASGSQRMGAEWKRGGGCQEIPDSSLDPVSVENLKACGVNKTVILKNLGLC